MTLAQLAPGESAVIRNVANTPAGLRLMAMGLTPGAPVACVGRAPFGAPSAYRVRRTVVALDPATASLVALRGAPSAAFPAGRPDSPRAGRHGRVPSPLSMPKEKDAPGAFVLTEPLLLIVRLVVYV